MRLARLMLLLAWLTLLSACTTITPSVVQSLQPFTAERSLAEYVRRASLVDVEQEPSHCCDYFGSSEVEEVVTVTGSRTVGVDVDTGTITNVQEQGVDEGDIVKKIGEHIVVLRRGRLFSFATIGGGYIPQAIDFIDVAPGEDDSDAWYDEMLVYGTTIVLLGFDWVEDQIVLRKYELSAEGQFSHGESHRFSAGDYFDGENYATRLIGNRLIFYLPRNFPYADMEERDDSGVTLEYLSPFDAEVIYQPLQHTDFPVLHTIASCPLDTGTLKCSATTIIGPYARLMYISSEAVYLWLNSSGLAYDFFQMSDRQLRRWAVPDSGSDDLAVVYRLPVDGSAPEVAAVSGWPMNQFSFTVTGDSLRVIVRLDIYDRTTRPAIWDIPFSRFGATLAPLPADRLTELPALAGDMTVNRFIGTTLLYDDRDDPSSKLLVKDLESVAAPVEIDLDFYVERIEPVGKRGVVIGSDERTGLNLLPIELDGYPRPGSKLHLAHSVQADARSHAFNSRPSGIDHILALPVVEVPETEDYESFWFEANHDVQMRFFELSADLRLSGLGRLEGQSRDVDYCIVSCTDWYGDSRAFFVDERFYALLGYELIAGYLSGRVVVESGRANGLDLFDENYTRSIGTGEPW